MSRKRLHRKSSKLIQRFTKPQQETVDAEVEIFQYPDGSMSVLPYRPAPEFINIDAQYLVKAFDRKWFRSHPHRMHRIRKAILGEGINTTSNTYVIVRQLKPGYRERISFEALVQLPEGDAPEHVAHAFFDLVKEAPDEVIRWDKLAARMHAYESAGTANGAPDDPPKVH